MHKLTAVFFLFILITACGDDKPASTGQASAQQNIKNGLPENVIALKEAAARYKDSAALQLQLAHIYDSLSLYNDAIKTIDLAIKNDSLNSELWFTKGLYQQNAGDTSGALQSYNRSNNIYPQKQTLLYLGNLYALKRDNKALLIVKALSDQVYDATGSAELDFISGTYYARVNNVKQALFYLDKAIAADFKLMDAYIEKGILLAKNKRYDEALKIYDASIAVDARYADAYYFKGQCYEAMNKKAEAIEQYETALQFDENITEAKDAIARLK